jgi:hypothetical protein
MTTTRFTIAAAVNDMQVLHRNLYRSPGLRPGTKNQLIIKRDFPSASLAYNSVIDEAENDIIVFAHQDVYLPATWFADLNRCLDSLTTHRLTWGVLGCFGSRRNAEGGVGRVYTNGLGVHGKKISEPEPIETLDEIVLVLRKSSGLRFDPSLPSFHLYGADLCLSARDQGLLSYAFQGFCIHNTNQLLRLPREFGECYHYLRRKWKKFLPVYASCMKISYFNEAFYLKRLHELRVTALRLGRPARLRVADPRSLLMT